MSKIDDLIQELCPDGVEYKTLDEIGSLISGLSGKSKKDFVESGNAFYATYRNVFNNPSLDFVLAEPVMIGENEKQNRLCKGDIIFTGSSESMEEAGMTSVLEENPPFPLYLNSFCFVLRPTENVLYPSFSKHLFRSTTLRKEISKCSSGVTRYNVSKKRLLKISIPLPDLRVQKEIAGVLDSFAQLEAQLEAELEARRRQYYYFRSDLLNLKGSTEVSWVSLGDLGSICMCKRIFKEETSPSEEIPFYKIGTFGGEPDSYISKELFEAYREKYSYPKKGDILISCSGTIGRSIVFDGKPSYFQDSNIVWVDNDESKVLNSFLRQWYAVIEWPTSKGGTIGRLYTKDLKKIKVPILPLSEQQRIVDILNKFDVLVNGISEGLPAEIEARRKQYEYYRDKLLTFKKKEN